MALPGNGNLGEYDEGQERRLLQGARSVDTVIPTLTRAADAILDAGYALSSMANSLRKISDDTARSISDTVVLKKYIREYMAREEKLRSELGKIKERLPPLPKPRGRPRKKRRKVKREE